MPGAAMKGTPLVSVIIPAFNKAWCIERTLEGVKRQVLEDYEVIIIDDGSAEGTAEVVRRAIAGDPRFRLIVQQNAGVAVTRNRGIALARGKYVAPLDADDVWLPHFLEKAVAVLEARQPETVLCFARSLWIDADDAAPPQLLMRIPAVVDYRELLLRNPIGNGSASVIRRDALLAVGGYDPEVLRKYGQADDWWTQLQLSWRGEIAFIDEPLVLYRISRHAVSHATLERMARATRAIIVMARRSGPRLTARDYRNARSLAMLWQMRRARQSRRFALMFRLAAHAYLRNPLWFLEPDLRRPLANVLVWPLRAFRPRRSEIWSRLLDRDAKAPKRAAGPLAGSDVDPLGPSVGAGLRRHAPPVEKGWRRRNARR